MEKITSYDGTQIAYHRTGTGPALILVPGAGAANPVAWTDVIPKFAERFCVYAMDRRGHGESGDSTAYALEREFEDVAALADSTGEPVNLLGHSFGGLVALGASLLAKNLRRLILYEPAIPSPGAPIYQPGLIQRLQARLDAGYREGVLTLFYRDVAELSPEFIEQMRSTPAWAERVAAAHALPREMQAEEEYQLEPERFAEMRTPTLLLLGSESPAFLRKTVERVGAALPMSRSVVMEGQEHVAMYTAPEVFVKEVVGFLMGE